MSAGIVADINTTDLGIGPSRVVQVGLHGFFAANDGVQSRALWVTDGTAAGTHPLKDVNVVVPVGEDPTATPPAFVDVNGIAYFAADDGVHGVELWKSDGTPAGTSLVADLTPGTAGSSISNLAPFGGKVVFDASGAAGTGLYSSDGTAAGTQFLQPFAVLPDVASEITTPMTPYNGALYFLGGPNVRQFQLWKTDGTAAGTQMVDDINGTGVPLAGYGPNMAVVNGSLYFAAETGGSLYQNIWVSDGTSAGTRQITHYSGSGFALINYLTAANGSLYFLYSPSGSAFASGSIVKSDGTEAGTQVVPLPVDPSNHEPIVAFGPLVAVGSSVYFAGGEIIQNIRSAVIANEELWKTDGTAAGTQQVADINPALAASSTPQSLYNLAGTLYFTADDGNHGREVWKTDGTASGTQLVKDINPGAAGSAPATYSLAPLTIGATVGIPFAGLNGKLLFAASRSSDGTQLWTSDGSADGTVPLTSGVNTADSAPQSIVTGGGHAFFAADDGIHGEELWTSDGTTAGTRLLADINIGAGSSSPRDLFYANGKLYFVANDGHDQHELYASDGTTGAGPLTNPLPLPPGSPGSDFRVLGYVNGAVMFRRDSALWKTDGTMQGTSQVMAFSAMDFGVTAVVGSTLYFVADDGTHGMELWKTNGTAAGTAMVKDINPSGSSSPFGLTNVNGVLFFAATDGTTPGLWKSNGTAAGTVVVATFPDELETTGFSENIFPPAVLNGVLYFAAGAGESQLWRSDGTPAGTFQLKQFPLPPVRYSGISNMAVLGNSVYFGADDGTHGMELWKTDGTAAGTVMVADVLPGDAPSTPQSLTVFNGALYFTALRAGGGRTLWVTTGSSVREVAGIAAAPFDPNVQQLAVGPTGVFFSATDPRHGQELWQLGGDISASLFNDANNNGARDAGEAGLAGWTIYIDANDNGILDPPEVSTTTDSTGNYDFTGVGPGTFHIRQVLPASWRQTAPLAADPTASMSPNLAYIQAAVAGPVFGDVQVSTVSMNFNYLLTLAQHYGQPGTFASGDVTGDGQVNFDDLLLVAQNYGHSLSASAAANAFDLLTRRRKAQTR